MKKHLPIWRRAQKDCTTTIEVAQWLPLAAFGLFLFWYLANPNKIVSLAAATLLGCVVVAFTWAFQQARHVRAARRLRYSALQVGDELEEELELDNQSIFPVLWAEFVDRSNLPGYTVTSVHAAGAKSVEKWRAETICERRGVYVLGPWELLLGDPLGIFRVRQVYQEQREILIYPPLADMPDCVQVTAAAEGDQRALHQPIGADTANAFSTRPYAPGDPLRNLHWRTTARREQPFVKLFEPESATSVWLVADCDPNVHRKVGKESSFEAMIMVLATLAARMLREQLAVGLYAAGADQTVVLPERGQPHQWDILKALAPLEMNGPPLAAALQSLRPLVSARNTVVLVTPSLAAAWLPELSRLAGLRGGRAAQVVLLDPRSFGGSSNPDPLPGLLAEAGIRAQIIRGEQIKPISGAYGSVRRWEFQSLATGRVVARHTPRGDDIRGPV